MVTQSTDRLQGRAGGRGRLCEDDGSAARVDSPSCLPVCALLCLRACAVEPNVDQRAAPSATRTGNLALPFFYPSFPLSPPSPQLPPLESISRSAIFA